MDGVTGENGSESENEILYCDLYLIPSNEKMHVPGHFFCRILMLASEKV